MGHFRVEHWTGGYSPKYKPPAGPTAGRRQKKKKINNFLDDGISFPKLYERLLFVMCSV